MILGRTEPRLYTPPLRRLTPETSLGFDQVRFARDVLRHPFDPWQEFAVIHAGELRPDGQPRFRIVLVIVARQNGKTEIPVILSLYWQFVEQVPLILGTSTKLDYARESWTKAVQLAEQVAMRDDAEGRAMAALMPKRWKREANGEQESWTVDPQTAVRSRYKIAASNEEGGRSLTVHRLICDELRQHRTYAAWNAAEPATSAVWDAQIWCLSNAGDDRSVVLNDLRSQALQAIERGDQETDVCLLEWSAPEDSDPEDVDALAQANPNLGRRKNPAALLMKARRAKMKGGEALAGFLTEDMCIHVPDLSPAIDAATWADCLEVGDLADVRSRVALCLDVAPDGAHATVAAAAQLPDRRVRGEIVAAWEGAGCTERLRAELPELVRKVRPRVLGWLPQGPAAAVAASLAAERSGPAQDRWPPPGVRVQAIRGEAAAVCMGLADLVQSRAVLHAGDPLLEAQVRAAQKRYTGQTWVFDRPRGEDAPHVDAVYAFAGAVYLAQLVKPSPGKPRLIVVNHD